MQRYDALLEKDPEGGWVQYEDVQDLLDESDAQDLLDECDAIVVSIQKRLTEKENAIADWKSLLLKKESIIGSLRGSLVATNDALNVRIRMNSSLFEDLERQVDHSDKLGRRLNSTYTLLAISTLANISWLAYFFIETIGAYIGAFN